jgi:hypothetical protein
MTMPTRLRPREILTAQLAACRQANSNYARGGAAALAWLTTGGPAPLTGALYAATLGATLPGPWLLLQVEVVSERRDVDRPVPIE